MQRKTIQILPTFSRALRSQQSRIDFLKRFVIILGLMDSKYVTGKESNAGYDALRDKHASFYFSGYGVKKHLKKLRKVFEMEPHQKGYREYSEMIAHKLDEIERSQEDLSSKVEPYKQTLKPASLQKLKTVQHYFQQHSTNRLSKNDKRQDRSYRNLPNIAKTTLTIHRSKELLSFAQAEKKEKSPSIVGLSTKNMGKMVSLVNRDRSNKSLQASPFKYRQNREKDQLKEVQHEDFLAFLKKKQEDVLSLSKMIKKQRLKVDIKEDLQEYA